MPWQLLGNIQPNVIHNKWCLRHRSKIKFTLRLSEVLRLFTGTLICLDFVISIPSSLTLILCRAECKQSVQVLSPPFTLKTTRGRQAKTSVCMCAEGDEQYLQSQTHDWQSSTKNVQPEMSWIFSACFFFLIRNDTEHSVLKKLKNMSKKDKLLAVNIWF